MLFGRIGKGGRRLVPALGVSAAALSVCCIQALAEDQAMTVPATVLAHASSGPLQCEIRKKEIDGAVELTGVIESSRALAGNFRFTVTKSGPSGSSNINQGQKFDLAAGKESLVGQVRINRERDAHVAIELFVGSNDGLECQVKTSLEP
jgi:hypothetical protein